MHIFQCILSLSQLVSSLSRQKGRKWLEHKGMCYRFLSISPTPVHALSASWMSYICYLSPLPQSARWGRRTFSGFGRNMTSVLRILLDLKASGCHVTTVCADRACAVGISSFLQAFRLAAVRTRLYHVPHPSNATLGRKQTQLLLAIDAFVVPQSSAATAVTHSRQTSECLQHPDLILSVTCDHELRHVS